MTDATTTARTRINLERKDPVNITEQQRATALNVFMGIIDGLAEPDRRNWRRFWRIAAQLEMGDIMTIEVISERQPAMHRRHMAMESAVFNAQEQFALFDPAFRDWLKTGSGFVTWEKNEAGDLTAKPKSSRYEECGEIEFREFHENSLMFLRSPRALEFLWPHLTPRARLEMIHGLIGKS